MKRARAGLPRLDKRSSRPAPAPIGHSLLSWTNTSSASSANRGEGVPLSCQASRSRGRTRLTTSAPPRSRSRQLGRGNTSRERRGRELGLELAPRWRRGGEVEGELLDRRVVADDHHRGDVVRHPAQALEEDPRARAVELGLVSHGHRPERRLDTRERLSRAARRRAQHELGRDLMLAQVPRDRTGGTPSPGPRAAGRDRPARAASNSTSRGAAGRDAWSWPRLGSRGLVWTSARASVSLVRSRSKGGGSWWA